MESLGFQGSRICIGWVQVSKKLVNMGIISGPFHVASQREEILHLLPLPSPIQGIFFKSSAFAHFHVASTCTKKKPSSGSTAC